MITHSHVFCVSGGELPAGVTAEQAAYPGDDGAGACAPPVVFERMCVGRCSCLVCRPSGRRASLSVLMLQRGIVFAGRRVCGGLYFSECCPSTSTCCKRKYIYEHKSSKCGCASGGTKETPMEIEPKFYTVRGQARMPALRDTRDILVS